MTIHSIDQEKVTGDLNGDRNLNDTTGVPPEDMGGCSVPIVVEQHSNPSYNSANLNRCAQVPETPLTQDMDSKGLWTFSTDELKQEELFGVLVPLVKRYANQRLQSK